MILSHPMISCREYCLFGPVCKKTVPLLALYPCFVACYIWCGKLGWGFLNALHFVSELTVLLRFLLSLVSSWSLSIIKLLTVLSGEPKNRQNPQTFTYMRKLIIVFQVLMVLSVGEIAKQALANSYTERNELSLISPLCCYTSIVT